jgi:hypothetical protein
VRTALLVALAVLVGLATVPFVGVFIVDEWTDWLTRL